VTQQTDSRTHSRSCQRRAGFLPQQPAAHGAGAGAHTSAGARPARPQSGAAAAAPAGATPPGGRRPALPARLCGARAPPPHPPPRSTLAPSAPVQRLPPPSRRLPGCWLHLRNARGSCLSDFRTTRRHRTSARLWQRGGARGRALGWQAAVGRAAGAINTWARPGHAPALAPPPVTAQALAARCRRLRTRVGVRAAVPMTAGAAAAAPDVCAPAVIAAFRRGRSAPTAARRASAREPSPGLKHACAVAWQRPRVARQQRLHIIKLCAGCGGRCHG